MLKTFLLVAVALLICVVAGASDWDPKKCGQRVAGPSSPALWREWIKNMTLWREKIKEKYHYYYGGAIAERDLMWTHTSYNSPQMHPFDHTFYNSQDHLYTVRKYINDTEVRFGGVDSLLLWPTYPNIGVDDRNQFDWFRSMPGGILALKQAIKELHDANIKVLLPYNPWDTGTHREPTDDATALALLIKQVDADGLNGDTMEDVPRSFYEAGRKLGIPIAIQPELGSTFSSMNWTTMTWGYWYADGVETNCVDRFKWIDARRVTNVCARWSKDRSEDVLRAFINGDGYVPWENVWGTWNGITPRDGVLITQQITMTRFFGQENGLLHYPWEPYFPTNHPSVATSRWNRAATDEQVFFLINKGNADVSDSSMLTIDVDPKAAVIDCFHGKRLTNVSTGRNVPIPVSIEKRGLGCIFTTRNYDSPQLLEFLRKIRDVSSVPLAKYSGVWKYLPQQMEVPAFTPLRPQSCGARMSKIPEKSSYRFASRGVEIEGPENYGEDFQMPWEDHPSRHHNQTLNMPPLCVDTFLVSNGDWKTFLGESGYVPRDKSNYLRFWVNGTYPSGAERQPVTWVSPREAQAYCQFYKKRLPMPYEWQYAAQGSDQRSYPWGNDGAAPGAMPAPTSGTVLLPPPNVDGFPAGASPFGVQGMVGIVWQWTSTFTDDHTHANLIRGGSYYRPVGSDWYLPHAKKLDEHNKYLLMDDAYDRAGTVGFRCVADVEKRRPTPI